MDELEAELQRANNKVCHTGHLLNQMTIKVKISYCCLIMQHLSGTQVVQRELHEAINEVKLNYMIYNIYFIFWIF